jgi:NAD(P)-dependent dehydrogenase (short-subunit alcohol dehydrogenase family)
MRLDHKIALITGAGSGIGEACAEEMAKEGATVIVTDIDEDKGQSVAEKCKGLFLPLDVRNESHWQKTMEYIVTRFSRLDVLVNNAGITGLGSELGAQDCENVSLEDWRKVHAINLDGTFLGCKYAIKVMKKNPDKKGSIINISSRSGLVGVPNLAAYASSKAAIRNHSKSVALYCANQGYRIRCNSLYPAVILTPLWDAMIGKGQAREMALKDLAGGVPLHELGTPQDIAYAVIYLASDESKFMTGSELVIDGGILAGSASSPGKH